MPTFLPRSIISLIANYLDLSKDCIEPVDSLEQKYTLPRPSCRKPLERQKIMWMKQVSKNTSINNLSLLLDMFSDFSLDPLDISLDDKSLQSHDDFEDYFEEHSSRSETESNYSHCS